MREEQIAGRTVICFWLKHIFGFGTLEERGRELLEVKGI